jgi:dihydrofolate reductase
MGKLVSTLFVTLDGVYQAPGGPQEDTRGGFTHGGWSFPYADEDFGRFIGEVFTRPGAFLLGRRTYDIFATYWPRVTDPADPVASRLNSLPKYVPSSTLTDPGWAGTTVLAGDLAEEVAAVKERTDGEVQVLLTFPVALGSGFRLFTEGAVPTAFEHTGGSVTGAGVSVQTYDLKGRPEYGEFSLPEDA